MQLCCYCDQSQPQYRSRQLFAQLLKGFHQLRWKFATAEWRIYNKGKGLIILSSTCVVGLKAVSYLTD